MFTRSQANGRPATPDAKTLEAFKSVPTGDARTTPPPIGSAFGPSHALLGASASPAAGAAAGSGFALGSIIGNDLTIVGQGLRILTKGTLQVDGRIEGDVVGKEVIVGERGSVLGVVSAESVVVRGHVQGTIKGLKVMLHSGARVEGDVHHQQLGVEEGASLDGRVRRAKDAAEVTPDFAT